MCRRGTEQLFYYDYDIYTEQVNTETGVLCHRSVLGLASSAQ